MEFDDNRVRILSIIAAILVAIGIGGWFLWDFIDKKMEFHTTLHEFTCKRDLAGNTGKVEARVIKCVNKQTGEVVGLDRLLTRELLQRTSAEMESEIKGDGVKIHPVWTNGASVVKRGEPWEITRWPAPTDSPARRNYVASRESDFKTKFVPSMTAAVPIAFQQAIVLDRTSGISTELATEVKATLNDRDALKIAMQDGNVNVGAYHLTSSNYQGGRRRESLTKTNAQPTLNALGQWLTSETAPEPQSAVLDGLRAVLRDIAQHHAELEGEFKRTVVDMYLDGLHNAAAPGLSIYRDPDLVLTPEGQQRLDQVFNLTGVKLAGVEIHLHPLPPTADADINNLSAAALDYIADRLTKTGAKVTREDF